MSLVTNKQQSPTFKPKRFHVGIEVEKVAAEQIFLLGNRFSPFQSFNKCFTLITNLSPTLCDFIKCQPPYTILLHIKINLSVAY
jgi:hypothetical protein